MAVFVFCSNCSSPCAVYLCKLVFFLGQHGTYFCSQIALKSNVLINLKVRHLGE